MGSREKYRRAGSSSQEPSRSLAREQSSVCETLDLSSAPDPKTPGPKTPGPETPGPQVSDLQAPAAASTSKSESSKSESRRHENGRAQRQEREAAKLLLRRQRLRDARIREDGQSTTNPDPKKVPSFEGGSSAEESERGGALTSQRRLDPALKLSEVRDESGDGFRRLHAVECLDVNALKRFESRPDCTCPKCSRVTAVDDELDLVFGEQLKVQDDEGHRLGANEGVGGIGGVGLEKLKKLEKTRKHMLQGDDFWCDKKLPYFLWKSSGVSPVRTQERRDFSTRACLLQKLEQELKARGLPLSLDIPTSSSQSTSATSTPDSGRLERSRGGGDGGSFAQLGVSGVSGANVECESDLIRAVRDVELEVRLAIGNAAWKAEVVLVSQACSAFRGSYFASQKFRHILEIKGVEFLHVKVGLETLTPGENPTSASADAQLLTHLTRDPNFLLRLPTYPSQAKSVENGDRGEEKVRRKKGQIKGALRLPQLLVNGVPICELDLLEWLENENHLDYILSEEKCPNCVSAIKLVKSPNGTQIGTQIGTQMGPRDSGTSEISMGNCGACGAVFRHLINASKLSDELLAHCYREVLISPIRVAAPNPLFWYSVRKGRIAQKRGFIRALKDAKKNDSAISPTIRPFDSQREITIFAEK